MPDCCREACSRKLSGVHAEPQSGPFFREAIRCTPGAKLALWNVVKAVTSTTINVGGVGSVSGRFYCDCQAVICVNVKAAAASRATTTPSELRAVHQPSLSWAASIHFGTLERLLWELVAWGGAAYDLEVVYEKYCFRFATPAEGRSSFQAEWALRRSANAAVSLSRPCYTVEHQQAKLLRDAHSELEVKTELLSRTQRELEVKTELLRHTQRELEALEVTMAAPNGRQLRENPLVTELDSHGTTIAAMTQPMWGLLNKSNGFLAWQEPASQHPASSESSCSVTPPEPALPSSGPAVWGGVNPANAASDDHDGPWIRPPTIWPPSVQTEAPVVGKWPFQSDQVYQPVTS
jgi:hypothetical protein